MKLIKLFENFQSDEEIIDICRKYDIQNYTINGDRSIDVDGNVDLYYKGLTKLPLNFNHVSGYFDCNSNELTTLQGAPKSVDGYFHCSNNELTTIQGAPQSVGGDFNCSENELTSLEGAPESVGHSFNCNYNKLTNLLGVPELIGRDLSCSDNQITTLEGPKSVGRYFNCYNNPIHHVWRLIYLDKWDNNIMDLLNDYQIFRDRNTIVKARLNSFLEDIGIPTIDKIDYYKLI